MDEVLRVSLDFYGGDAVTSYSTKPLPVRPRLVSRQRSKRIPRKPVGSGAKMLKGKTLKMDQRDNPPLPPAKSSLRIAPPRRKMHVRHASAPMGTGHNSSQKVRQLMGLHLAVVSSNQGTRIRYSSPVSAAHSHSSESWYSVEDTSDPSHLADPFQHWSLTDNEAPALEEDNGPPSQHSSWTPTSPSGTFDSTQFAVRNSDHFSPHTSFLKISPKKRERGYSHFSDIETANEYHKFAMELSHSTARAQSSAPTHVEPNLIGTLPRHISFTADNDAERPAKTIPSPIIAPTSRFQLRSQAPPTPFPPKLSLESPLVSGEPRPQQSIFEDSDSESRRPSGLIRGTAIRDWWKRHSGEARPAESTTASPEIEPVKSMDTQGDGARTGTSNQEALLGDSVKALWASARQGARILHRSKSERRRDQIRKDIRVFAGGRI